MSQIPICQVCSAPVTRYIKSRNQYWNWCSNACMGRDTSVLEKKKKTNIEKFGAEHPMHTSIGRDKLKATMMKNYGVDNPSKSAEVQQRMKDTFIRNYGVDNPSKNDSIKNKIGQKSLERYAERKSDIISKRRKTNIEKFGSYSNRTTHLTDETIKLIKDLNWLDDQHKNQKKSIAQIADELGCSSTPILKFLADNGYELESHSRPSSVEIAVGHFVSTLTNNEIIYNSRKIIPPQELDVYIPSKNLAIEINGVYWHSETNGKDQNYHILKTKQCESLGIQLLHIYDSEWHDPITQEILKSKINHIFGNSKRIFARKTIVKKIDNKTSTEFLEENHMQGSIPSKYRYGIYLGDQLVSVATFGIPRYNKNYDLELLRYTNKNYHTVVGGLSKIISTLISNVDITSIISYADRRRTAHLNQNLYDSTGFNFLRETPPNYKYFDSTDSDLTLQSRNKYQKNKLENLLEVFDKDLSEYENMLNNKYMRIWDCGNLAYEWKR